MTKKYRKIEISPELSEEGGATAVFVDKETTPLDGAIDDAIAGNYAIGNKALIRNTFFGLMQSMADGVRRDGRPRQVAGLITVYPVFKGPVDLEKGFDPDVNSVMIRARLLKEIDLDITKWTFEDVTPGKRAFRLTTVKAGEKDGEVVVGSAVEINGKDVPNKSAGEPVSVSWALTDGSKSGEVAAEKISGNISRIGLAEGALTGLTAEDDDGKEIEFTVRGNFSNATIKGVVRAASAPTLVVTGATSCVNPWTIHGPSGTGQFRMVGENILCTAGAEDEGVWFTYTDPETGEEVVKHAGPDKFHETAGSEPGTCPYVSDADLGLDQNPPDGETVHGTLRIACRAGVPGSALQVFEHACDWAED